MVDRILEVVRGIKLPPARLERFVVDEIAKNLVSEGISFEREVFVAKGSRVDFLVEGGVVIEVKKGKPNSKTVARQLERYASSDMVSEVILVSERGLVWHTSEANGKPVRYVSLSRNWGLTV